MKWTSKLGTVINIPDGLDPAVVKKWKDRANAGYGTEAQKMLNAAAKKTTANAADPAAANQTKLSEAVNPDGTVNPDAAGEVVGGAEKSDILANFKLNNPDQTDEFGNTITYDLDPATGKVTVKTTGGKADEFAKKAIDAAAGGANFEENRKKAQQATYDTLTRYYDRDQAREMTDAKQELAERGIPYDPAAAQDANTNNLYGKTVGGIGQKYQGLKDNAAQQAVISGNQTFATDSNAQTGFINTAANAATQFAPKFQPYVGQNTDTSAQAQDLLTLSSAAYLQKYGIDKDEATKRAAIAKSGAGGSGGGGSSSGGGAAGFEIVG